MYCLGGDSELKNVLTEGLQEKGMAPGSFLKKISFKAFFKKQEARWAEKVSSRTTTAINSKPRA
jgi:hypothetical protein